MADDKVQSAHDAAPKLYNKLSPEQLATLEVIQAQANSLESMLRVLAVDEELRVDPRWTAIARTHFQEGLMALRRAVTKPEFF
jgi:hypothetical protein